MDDVGDNCCSEFTFVRTRQFSTRCYCVRGVPMVPQRGVELVRGPSRREKLVLMHVVCTYSSPYLICQTMPDDVGVYC